MIDVYQRTPRLSNLRGPSDRPPILEVVSAYIPLKRAGREYIGLCPFHAEKRPSLYINPEKGLFHCFGCGEGGDVISFVQKIEKLSFRDALAHLSIAGTVRRPRYEEISARKELNRAREALAEWALIVTHRISSRMRALGQVLSLAQTILSAPGEYPALREELERATRQWEILETVQDDLADPNQLVGLWRQRKVLETVIGEADLDDCDLPAAGLPELTPASQGELRSCMA